MEDFGGHSVGLELEDPTPRCACSNTGGILSSICSTDSFSYCVSSRKSRHGMLDKPDEHRRSKDILSLTLE
jgi:hypothetical protein